MPRAREITRFKNTPPLDETSTGALYRLKSVSILALTTLRAIDLYFYDNDIESARISELTDGIRAVNRHECPRYHLERLMNSGYLWVVKRDKGAHGARHVALTDRAKQIIADYEWLLIDDAEHKGAA